jgi:2-polyprenyl-6-methoxyphenol hydroxylase-like FAD-dependent oxidoreductase
MSSVLVVGCGPVGITTACLLAANPNLKVTVIDKRATPTRSHGLSIHAESIAKVISVVDKAIINSNESESLLELRTIFTNWSDGFVRTNEIELQLMDLAERMDVKVLRGDRYEIREGDLQRFFDPGNKRKIKLKSLLKKASVIIACDGAHSRLRTELDIPFKVEEELKYMAELKYQTNGDAQQRSTKQAVSTSIKTGVVGVELMNNHAVETSKPATYLAFIDKDTFDAMRYVDNAGNVKGVYGNTLTLEDLEARKTRSPHIKPILRNFYKYLETVEVNGGECTNERIATLELKVYRNAQSVCKMFGKLFMFVGDANSGLIYQRGFNKGLKEAALCAENLEQFFTRTDEVEEAIPQEFLDYQDHATELFDTEMVKIYKRNAQISKAQKVVRITATSHQTAEESSTSRSCF